MESFARRIGRRLMRLDNVSRDRLLAYAWPGNVRELQNVIERGVITAVDGRLNIDRGLLSPARPLDADRPQASASAAAAAPGPVPPSASQAILTVAEMGRLERENIVRALHSAGWKVSGAGGAAALLGMNGSTLASRINALGIKREG
jgi:transcriptional regulator with GAF, ATPase, and Fis domain